MVQYPLADYALTPYMAIVDPQLVINMPKGLTAFGGIDALVHALVSVRFGSRRPCCRWDVAGAALAELVR